MTRPFEASMGRLRDEAHEDEDDGRAPTVRALLSLVEAHRPAPGRLLDVGCATGVFVAMAAESGWTVTGVETSTWALGRASQRCRQATFIQGSVEDLEFPEASFDVVTMWNVLEHVSSPTEILARLRPWLAPEGRLFLSLPNAGSTTARLMGRRWVLLLREHLWYFEPATLSRVLRQSGFETISARPSGVTFSIRHALARPAHERPDIDEPPPRPLADRRDASRGASVLRLVSFNPCDRAASVCRYPSS